MGSKEEALAERREQILDSAMACFVKHGIHQTTMHHISEHAGISVGLIYRYFSGKDDVIAAMAEDHKRSIDTLLQSALEAPNLTEALEIFFTKSCRGLSPEVMAGFIFDVYSTAARSKHVAGLVKKMRETTLDALTEVIAHAPEARNLPGHLSARDCAELIFAVRDGDRVNDIVCAEKDSRKKQDHRFRLARRLHSILFPVGASVEPDKKTKARISKHPKKA